MRRETRIIADSINTVTGDRITTFLLRYPRYIHAEFMTHRVMSRNSASSRAIPMKKFRDEIIEFPVLPIHWGANQKGMQAEHSLDQENVEYARDEWLEAKADMVDVHINLEKIGLHKQIANRILEPWMWIQVLCTATDYQNFFSLRCHSEAHPDIQALSDSMLEDYVFSSPRMVGPGGWHLPFGDQELPDGLKTEDVVKICAARAARLSYRNFEQKIDPDDDIRLHDKLVESGHWSPLEHPAQALPTPARCGNFYGWKQWRKFFPEENRKVDIDELYEQRKLFRTKGSGQTIKETL